MSGFGKYNASEPSHGSSLFGYGEVPVASNKLNVWNGNIEASLNWLVQCVAILMGGRVEDFVLDEEGGQELKARAANPPGLSIRIQPGRAMVAQYFSGLDMEQVFPSAGSLAVPVSHPRRDLIYLDRYGKTGLVQGQESESPATPAAPALTITLAAVHLRPGMASVQDADDGTNGYLIDLRPRLLRGLAHRHGSDRTPVESCDGERTAFSTLNKFVEGTLEVYVNGILQAAGVSFDPDLDRRGYVFTAPPPSGYRVEHRYLI
jgi:hypothetical protein